MGAVVVASSGPPSGRSQVPKPGEVIEGKYRVEHVVGEGGMGVVLAAHHVLLDQRVAVKVLTTIEPQALARFSQEAKATAQLKSEHVARVMDVGALPTGAPFIVMEYLEGCDLGELLRLNGRLGVTETVGYVLEALDGLAQAHALDIIHRDLKPANLFLAVQTNGTSTVKLVDFGISKSIASRRSGTTGVLTGDHSTVGSPTYMAPEQIRSPKDVDARSDIWALGVVLYELLSGAPPFGGDSVGEIFAAVLEKTPPRLSSIVPEVPAALSEVIATCMSDREVRYKNVLELARDLVPFGPPESATLVARIEQMLKAMEAKAAAGDRVSLNAARVTPAPVSSPAGLGAFSSDTAAERSPRSATLPSLRRQGDRRRMLTMIGAAGAGLVVVLIGALRISRSPTPAAASASVAQSGSPAAPSMAPPPDDSTVGADSPGAPVYSVDSLPSAKDHKPGAAHKLHRAPAAGKKRPAILDSPD
ncbi:MAG: serine/threonine-protein kinase [Polyangiaceae bacterium]